MNYLAQGLSEGWQTGTSLVEAKRKRKQEEEEKFLDRQMQLDRDARQEKLQRSLQEELLKAQGEQLDKRLDADALAAIQNRGQRNVEQANAQTFQAGESAADRALRAGEGLAERTTRSNESALDRAARADIATSELAQRERLANQQNKLSERQVAAHERTVDWETNPEAPRNKYLLANAQSKEMDAQMNGLGTPGGIGSPTATATFKSKDDVKKAIESGKISRESGLKILREKFGMQ